MIPLWRYLMWPIALLNRFRIGLRNKLFDLGVWKSVEFEMPVIYVGGPASEPSLAISFLISDLLSSPLHVEQLPNTPAKSSDSYLYLKSYQDIMFSTSHRILGLSEWVQHHEDTKAIVMDGSFAQNEIRPQLKVMISDFHRPFFRDELWPVGLLRGSTEEIQTADIVVFYDVPVEDDLTSFETMARKFLKDQVSIFFVKNSSQSMTLFNSADKIEFIKDRDNFARLIVNVLPNTNPESE